MTMTRLRPAAVVIAPGRALFQVWPATLYVSESHRRCGDRQRGHRGHDPVGSGTWRSVWATPSWCSRSSPSGATSARAERSGGAASRSACGCRQCAVRNPAGDEFAPWPLPRRVAMSGARRS